MRMQRIQSALDALTHAFALKREGLIDDRAYRQRAAQHCPVIDTLVAAAGDKVPVFLDEDKAAGWRAPQLLDDAMVRRGVEGSIKRAREALGHRKEELVWATRSSSAC